MKRIIYTFLISVILLPISSFSQDEVVHPTVIKTPVAFEITGPLSDNPIVTDFNLSDEEMVMNAHRDRELNPDIFPPDFDNMPEDPNVQTKPGWIEGTKATLTNFAGQNSGSYPPDCNGTVGANYYFQVVNTTYEIFNKSTGASVAGPSNLNTIFNSSLPGASCNSGDPIVLWDEQADRWFYAEFSLCTSNDYMLIAVSQTSDPTGSWYSWSFDVDDMPDYMKFGIWQDGYYMATNTSPGNDVYVFERSVMIAGGASPQMIAFDNPNRPSTFDGFHCILPLDNDGAWAPSGDPGQFITIADDGQSNAADQLWIYQLNANWTTPGSSTFSRTQTLNVNSFSGNFTGNWDNIPQPNTSTKLDGLSTILMYRAQYRNFTGTQRLVVAHAIAATSSEADLRWYELENTGSGWSIRQQSTYNPDNVSRWNMSIAMNGDKEIGIGYSVGNASVYPGIRYAGQSASANAAANNTLDMAETTIWTGSNSQTAANRWGDYSNISVDPTDDHVFWYTNEYMGSSTHGTRIASFQLSSPSSPPVADFSADNLYPIWSTNVNFTDLSTGTSPLTYQWTFTPSTVTYISGSSTSASPTVRFNNNGVYTVSLYVSNPYGNDTETKTDYIHVGTPGLWKGGWASNPVDWNTKQNWDNGEVPLSTSSVSITGAALFWPTKTGNLIVGTDCNSLNMASGLTELTVTGDLTISSGKTFYVDPAGTALIKVGGDWTNNGIFTFGQSTLELYGANNSVINSPAGGPAYLINDDISVWPGNWSGDIGSGNGQFNQNSSNYAGGSSPEARFLWQSGSATKQMIHSAVNTSGLTSLTLDFRHMVNDYSGSGYTIKVQYSTDGSTWNDVWSVSPTGDIAATSVSIPLSTSQGVGSATYYISFTITGNLYNIDYWYIDDVQLYYNISGLETFNNVEINKTNALVSTNGNVDVQQDFTIKPGAYFTNGTGNTFTVLGNSYFEADPSGMASFIDNGTSNFVNNQPNVQLYLSDANPGNWHFLSPPIVGAQSGLFTGSYLYSFDEPNDAWVNIVPQTTTLNIMQGYSAWTPLGAPNNVVFSGPLNNGPYNIAVTRNSNASTDHGWNLVGNPYPSSLDWNASGWTKTNVNNTIYYYSGSGGTANYKYYIGTGGETPGVGTAGGSNVIPPLQGFFVHVDLGFTTGTLGVTNTQRIHNNHPYYKGGENEIELPLIRILAEGAGLTDEAIIRFYEGAISEFDGDYDAFKLFADNYPQVYTLTPSGTELAISTLPEITDDLVVPVSFLATAPGTYSFTFTELIGFEQQGNLYLEDILTGDIQEVSENTIYTFVYSPLDDANRFLLHFGNPNGIGDETMPTISIYSHGDMVYIQKPAGFEGQVSVYDMLGQEILSQKAIGEGLISIPIKTGTGYYFVKVQSGGQLATGKVFIK